MRLLLLLVRLYPRGFRRQFGPDIEEQIESDIGRARARGPLHAFGFLVATSVDLVRSVVAERWDPAWGRGRYEEGREGGMGTRGREWTGALRFAVRSPAVRPSRSFPANGFPLVG